MTPVFSRRNLISDLQEFFEKEHRTARFYVLESFAVAGSPVPASPNPDLSAAIASPQPAYVLDMEVTAFDQKKFPPEVTVHDEITDAANGTKLFGQNDAILDDGRGDLVDVVATALATRIYSRFTARARDPRPAPEVVSLRDAGRSRSRTRLREYRR